MEILPDVVGRTVFSDWMAQRNAAITLPDVLMLNGKARAATV
jgi:hypothetical protein